MYENIKKHNMTPLSNDVHDIQHTFSSRWQYRESCLLLKIPVKKREVKAQFSKQWMNEMSDTHWSEDHMQRHGDVKVQSVVIDHADGKEHRHHDHIVTAKEKDTKGHERHQR